MNTHAAQKRQASRPKRILKVLSIIALLLLIATIALLVWIHASTIGKLETIENTFPEESTRPTVSAGNTAKNFLILGSDSRISAGDPKHWEAGAQRTDTMMLVQLSEKNNTLTFMSIPRDSWVDIPGHGKAKINAAYSYGGPQLTIQTVEKLTGVRIDHFALVDFTTFTRLTDELGGVTIPTTEGDKTMNGQQALRFVRERYSLAGGDFDRVKRQQAWVRAVIKKSLSKDVLSSPTTLMSMIQTVSADTATDADLTTGKLLSYAMSAKDIRNQNINFITSPYSGTGTSEDGQSIVVLDNARLNPLMEAWRKDELKPYLQKHGGDIPGLSQVVN